MLADLPRPTGLTDRMAMNLATLGPAGRMPKAPGTWGSLAAALLAPIVFLPLPLWARIIVLAAIFPIGSWAAGRAELIVGRKDPGHVVVDELWGTMDRPAPPDRRSGHLGYPRLPLLPPLRHRQTLARPRLGTMAARWPRRHDRRRVRRPVRHARRPRLPRPALSTMPVPALPIDTVLPELQSILKTDTACVVQAPPGSGKTTRIPLALMNAPWLAGCKILMLEPRRLAARAAARHMANLLNEKAGQRIGYRTRLDIRVSSATRVEVVTEGILTRMLQNDPELSGYACVIFDEFHERSLQADLGLALCLEVRAALRPDLRLIVMSATLDAENVSELLKPCHVLTCPGQPFDVETRYLRLPERFTEERMARAISLALTTEQGGILAFLPGAREIRRTQELLGAPGPGIEIHPLLGALTAAEQDKAIAPPEPGTRKVVLATAIAETSLTIEGVRVVVDSGLARLPRFDPASGMTVLVTEPASMATIAQRCGRAGRTGPGLCLRIWDHADEISRKPFPAPEMLEADLAPLALDLALWGAADPAELAWLTRRPPEISKAPDACCAASEHWIKKAASPPTAEKWPSCRCTRAWGTWSSPPANTAWPPRPHTWQPSWPNRDASCAAPRTCATPCAHAPCPTSCAPGWNRSPGSHPQNPAKQTPKTPASSPLWPTPTASHGDRKTAATD